MVTNQHTNMKQKYTNFQRKLCDCGKPSALSVASRNDDILANGCLGCLAAEKRQHQKRAGKKDCAVISRRKGESFGDIDAGCVAFFRRRGMRVYDTPVWQQAV